MTAPSDDKSARGFDAERLHGLIAAAIEGTLADPDYKELDQTLDGSADARRLYRDLMQVDAGVDWLVRGGRHADLQTISKEPAREVA